jgi:hypothetical protein
LHFGCLNEAFWPVMSDCGEVERKEEERETW